MRYVSPDVWKPRGIIDLEAKAWEALRYSGSCSVIASPGAGKTEFLAQRATYLLETGLCPSPRKILAISFKTDAAENLRKRVRERCLPEFSERFISVTFDAFTKNLVDRFSSALPCQWSISQPYTIDLQKKDLQIRDILTRIRLGAPEEFQKEIIQISPQHFESRQVGLYRLPLTDKQPESSIEYAVFKWLETQLGKGKDSVVSFTSLNRLAELLVRSNIYIRRALLATYQYVFVDEFQDTTYAQYDFLHSVFWRTSTVITVVGDNKQRIMTWAGARKDAFEKFEKDFSAKRISLVYNYRSSQNLVDIQQKIAATLEPQSIYSLSQVKNQISDDAALIWKSASKKEEIQHLANWLLADMKKRKKNPNDYAILVRQRAADYESELTPIFHTQRQTGHAQALGR